jgi:polyferredoxin
MSENRGNPGAAAPSARAGSTEAAAAGPGRLAGRPARRGVARRALPVRRIVQMVSLALFLYLFFYVAWPYATAFSSTVIADKAWLPLESFLWLDPLCGISTAVAGRHWNVALLGAAAVLFVGLLLPRGFCGYVCPLGTLLDGFDWLIGRRLRPPKVARRGSWTHTRYYLLAAVLAGSVCGILLAGYLAALPVLTRGLLFTAGRLELGLLKNWGQVAPADAALYLSVSLLAAIFLLGLLAPRFWCRHVCPSGALLSLFSLARLTERRVGSACSGCGHCVRACPFGAIGADFRARPLECASCRTCQGLCPAGAIRFTARWAGGKARAPAAPSP